MFSCLQDDVISLTSVLKVMLLCKVHEAEALALRHLKQATVALLGKQFNIKGKEKMTSPNRKLFTYVGKSKAVKYKDDLSCFRALVYAAVSFQKAIMLFDKEEFHETLARLSLVKELSATASSLLKREKNMKLNYAVSSLTELLSGLIHFSVGNHLQTSKELVAAFYNFMKLRSYFKDYHPTADDLKTSSRVSVLVLEYHLYLSLKVIFSCLFHFSFIPNSAKQFISVYFISSNDLKDENFPENLIEVLCLPIENDLGLKLPTTPALILLLHYLSTLSTSPKPNVKIRKFVRILYEFTSTSPLTTVVYSHHLNDGKQAIEILEDLQKPGVTKLIIKEAAFVRATFYSILGMKYLENLKFDLAGKNFAEAFDDKKIDKLAKIFKNEEITTAYTMSAMCYAVHLQHKSNPFDRVLTLMDQPAKYIKRYKDIPKPVDMFGTIGPRTVSDPSSPPFEEGVYFEIGGKPGSDSQQIFQFGGFEVDGDDTASSDISETKEPEAPKQLNPNESPYYFASKLDSMLVAMRKAARAYKKEKKQGSVSAYITSAIEDQLMKVQHQLQSKNHVDNLASALYLEHSWNRANYEHLIQDTEAGAAQILVDKREYDMMLQQLNANQQMYLTHDTINQEIEGGLKNSLLGQRLEPASPSLTGSQSSALFRSNTAASFASSIGGSIVSFHQTEFSGYNPFGMLLFRLCWRSKGTIYRMIDNEKVFCSLVATLINMHSTLTWVVLVQILVTRQEYFVKKQGLNTETLKASQIARDWIKYAIECTKDQHKRSISVDAKRKDCELSLILFDLYTAFLDLQENSIISTMKIIDGKEKDLRELLTFFKKNKIFDKKLLTQEAMILLNKLIRNVNEKGKAESQVFRIKAGQIYSVSRELQPGQMLKYQTKLTKKNHLKNDFILNVFLCEKNKHSKTIRQVEREETKGGEVVSGYVTNFGTRPAEVTFQFDNRYSFLTKKEISFYANILY
eukprot:snap_masked-scaffold_51-processed-gene-1.33-mRNA-1 protein AED:1.00 eAED:1.00 QI:0/0/0/0/1/1/2/0/966